ncbi:MAG TPA: hypothetical protein VID51_07530 [Solirubrobacterales bacterium]|jgi:hypothetical protein
MSPIDQSGSLALSKERRLELLRRFAPRLHFDALERWRPSLADPYLERSAFVGEDEQTAPGTPPAEAAMLERLEELKSRLNPLDRRPDRKPQKRSNALLQAYAPAQNLATGGTCYGRVVAGGTNTKFLQYWLFYVDNPCVLPPGRHDGDWELVQVRAELLDGSFEATHVTLAGHGKPVTRPFESRSGGPDVYVAVDSHASYHERGAHPMLPLSDVSVPDLPDPGLMPEVVLLPLDETQLDWAHWHGRWGMDRGVGTWLALQLRMKRTPSYMRRLNRVGAGESPPSPGRQGASWSQPRSFELRGTQRRWTNVAVQRLAHFIGKATWPRSPLEVAVTEVASGSYAIEARPTGHLARRVTLVSVTFWEERPDGARRSLAMHSVPAGKLAGPFAISHEGRLRWRAAGYNRLRQRGEPIGPGEPAQ